MESWRLSEWLEYQQTLNSSFIDLDLSRIEKVSNKLDILPPETNKFLIAGTNGKGTTVAFIQDILLKKNMKVGTYTSPHLKKYNERVTINKQDVEDYILIEAFQTIEAVRDNVPLTYFEFGTLAAFLVLSRANCDAWVIEVGLGGRLDATNILEPTVSIITNIALDHQEWLGDTLEEIAIEKSGIIKPSIPVVYGEESMHKIVSEIANNNESELFTGGINFFLNHENQECSWNGINEKITNIITPDNWGPGEYQNLATALSAIELINIDILPKREELNEVLEKFYLPGRFEEIKKDLTWILDVAHNPDAASNLLQRFKKLPNIGKNFMIISMMKDKDFAGFIDVFSNIISEWIVCEMDSDRSSTSEELYEKLVTFGLSNVTVMTDPKKAFNYVKGIASKEDKAIITGSFELVGPAIIWLDSIQ